MTDPNATTAPSFLHQEPVVVADAAVLVGIGAAYLGFHPSAATIALVATALVGVATALGRQLSTPSWKADRNVRHAIAAAEAAAGPLAQALGALPPASAPGGAAAADLAGRIAAELARLDALGAPPRG